MSAMRLSFMTCVPLFLLLTGYLMNHKQLGRHYYRGILHTLGIYGIISLFSVLYKILFLGKKANFIVETLNYTGSQYAWYIEMYLGLFVLIPFLNVLWHGLESKKSKQTLLFTVFILVTVPSMSNIFGIKIMPEWWVNIWPLLYYFTGCYIEQYKPCLSLRRIFCYYVLRLRLVYFLIYIEITGRFLNGEHIKTGMVWKIC